MSELNNQANKCKKKSVFFIFILSLLLTSTVIYTYDIEHDVLTHVYTEEWLN